MDPAFASPRETFSMKLPATDAAPLAPTGLWGVRRPNAEVMYQTLQEQQAEP
jgi:hypothetical protein